jgi:hypothetical protein
MVRASSRRFWLPPLSKEVIVMMEREMREFRRIQKPPALVEAETKDGMNAENAKSETERRTSK